MRRGHDKFRALLVGAAAVSIVDRSLTHQVARLYDGHVGGAGEQHRQRHAEDEPLGQLADEQEDADDEEVE